jgi:cytochrome c biogenesis protein CcmG/thiol:disulfide interchange protein DsbE
VVVVAIVGGVTAWAVVANDDATVATQTTRPKEGASDSDLPPPGSCTPNVAPGPATVGGAAPTFRLRGLDGGCVDLAALRGHPVVINFWASWCFPCREEMPLLRDAYAEHHDEGLEIVGIPYRDIPSDSRAFAKKYGATWLLARDPESAVANAYGVRPIPQSIFVRRDGTIASHIRGMTSAEFRRELEKILRSQP